MKSLRSSVLAAIALGLCGLAAMRLAASPEPQAEHERVAIEAEDRAPRSSSHDAPTSGPVAPPVVHPSTMLAWASEGHRVDPDSFREATVLELTRIDSAGVWLDRLDAEAAHPSCANCRPALDDEGRRVAREALSAYRETLASIAQRDLQGEDAVVAYRAARETLLSDLPIAPQAWLGMSGFLDSNRPVDELSPRLTRSTREMIAGDAPNTTDGPEAEGI